MLKDGSRREVKRPKAERMTAYAGLACGLAFLVARVAFEAAPTLRTVTIAAYTQRRQRRSGEIGDDFVYEVTIGREHCAELNLQDLDPVAEIKRLPSRVKQTTTGQLSKISAPEWAQT